MTLSGFWHGILHGITFLAGAVATYYPDPTVKAIAIGVGLLSGGTAAFGSSSSTPPPSATVPVSPAQSVPAPATPAPVSPAVVNTVTSLFAVCLAGWALMGSAGCSSLTQSQAQTAAAIAEPITEIVVLKVLDKNPQLEPVVQALSDAAGDAFNGGTLGATQVNAIVIAVTAKYPQLGTTDQVVLTALLDQLLASYQAISGKSTLDISDPAAKTLVVSFQNSIAQGLNLYRAVKPASN